MKLYLFLYKKKKESGMGTFIQVGVHINELNLIHMYKLTDYMKRGSILLNNMLFPNHKKLATVMLYTTDRCNSRCRHCYIWNKSPKSHLTLEQIKRILHSPAISENTLIGLEGGEFILHPEAIPILDYFSHHHPNFDLLSNGVAAEKLISLVKQYPPKRLYISLDGTRETHDRMRRVNGLYDNVMYIIKELKGEIPLSVMFTLTPFNSLEDLKHVALVCKSHGVDMRTGIYNNMEYFQTKESGSGDHPTLNYCIQDIPVEIKAFGENYDFLMLYTLYRKNETKLTCNSVKDSIVIYPNGDVPLCQYKQIILGNIRDEPLEVILGKKQTQLYHKKYHSCNECWVSFHRKYDIVLYRNMEKVLPQKVIRKLVGDYTWSRDSSVRYCDLFHSSD